MSLCILTNANVSTQLAGQIVRIVGATALLAQADSSANSTRLVGVRIDDVLAGASGPISGYTPVMRLRMDAEPTVGAEVYLSAATPGNATPTAPTISIVMGICYAKEQVLGIWYSEVIPESIGQSGNVSLTAKGDLLTFDGTSLARLPVGTNGQALTARSTAPNGIDWETPATNLSSAGSVFSLTGPLGAASAALGWDFSRYNPTLTVAQNLYNCNISGDPLNATPVAAGSPTYGYRRLLAGGFGLGPALASSQGGSLQDDVGTNASGSVGNSVWSTPADNLIRITSELTIEALFSISAMTTATGDNWSIVACCGEGETEGANILYQITMTVSAGPVFTIGYVAEHDAGVNITATLAVIQNPLSVGNMLWTLTRDVTGRVRFYIDGQAVSALITPTDGGGGGVILPTRGASPVQTLQLSRVGTQGTNLKQWQALKITPACFTEAQVNESYRRSLFGVGSTIS